MISREDIKLLPIFFTFWDNLKVDDRAKIILSSRILSLKKEFIFVNSLELNGLFLIKSGRLKFFTSSPEGREIPLYYLKEHEIEFLSPITLNNNIEFLAEENTEILLIPISVLNIFRKKYPEIERTLHDINNRKLLKAFHALQKILFVPLRKRLIDFLLEFKTSEISITHDEIAKKLGSSREVITRILKKLEKEKFLKTGRNKIILSSM